MDLQKEPIGILDLTICPGFSVKDNIITEVNQAAMGLLLTPGTDVRTLLLTGAEEYEAFQGGCLYLKLNLSSEGLGASVIRRDDRDIFLLDQIHDDNVLRALALAAQELRDAMTSTIIAADQLSDYLPATDPAAAEHMARLDRGICRMLRIVGNMSDAQLWPYLPRQESWNIDSVFAEIFEKAQTLAAHAGIQVTYQGLAKELRILADKAQLERAVLNILSNSLKFTPKGGRIQAKLTMRGRMLRLSIQDNGCGIREDIRSTLFSRYLRQPAVEDSRFGLGLGMVLIRSAAAAHGGTVLVDQPEGQGTRVTLTLAIRQNSVSMVRSPMPPVDYAGERDHGLLELSETLPTELYQK